MTNVMGFSMRITDEVSRKIETMSLLCALLVVCIHISAAGTGWYGQRVWPWFPGLIMRMAVPFFFMASGFLLAGHAEDENWWRDALKKRVKTLLMPYITLNVIWFVIKYSIHWYGVVKFGARADTLPLSWVLPLTIFGLPPGGPMLGPLWYVRNLVFLIVVSPMMVYVLRKSRVLAWVCVAGCFVAWMMVSELDGDNMWFSFAGLFCFWIGMMFRYYGLPVFSKWLGVCALFVAILIGVQVGPMSINALSPVKYVFCIVGIWTFIPQWKLPFGLGEMSFPIYVLHGMFIYFLSVALKFVHRYDLVGHGMMYLIFFVVSVVGPIVVAKILATRFPSLCKLMLGGRVGGRVRSRLKLEG